MLRRALCFALLAVFLPVFSTAVPLASTAKASPSATSASRKSTATRAARSRAKKLPRSQTVTMKQLGSIFAWAARQKDIAFRYPADGCYARAHLLVRRLQRAGYKPYKVWSMRNGEDLYVRTRNDPRGHVTWKYHVAPILRVRGDNDEQSWYVIDPSLFSRPVKISTWRSAQQRPGSARAPYVTVTSVGVAPLNPQHKRLPGSGYWLGSDPREGPDTHAMRIMRRYKPWEGKLPPVSVTARGEPEGPATESAPSEVARAGGVEGTGH
jgi:hypothetical protein